MTRIAFSTIERCLRRRQVVSVPSRWPASPRSKDPARDNGYRRDLEMTRGQLDLSRGIG